MEAIGKIFKLFPDSQKREALKSADFVADSLTSKGYECRIVRDIDTLSSSDIIITFGGDGHVLAVANLIAQNCLRCPIVRVNFGRAGYLTNVEPSQIYKRLENILQGDFIVQKRTRIEIDSINIPKINSGDALNEIVLERIQSRSISFDFFDGNNTYSIIGDGIIASTLTGSTAYNRSVGGPTLIKDAFVFTPISPIQDIEIPKFFIRNKDRAYGIDNIKGDVRLVADGKELWSIEDSVRYELIIKKSRRDTYFMEFGYTEEEI